MRPTLWRGMEITPYSKISAVKPVMIDRCAVRYYETLFGDGYFQLEGAHISKNDWVPLGPPVRDAHTAWEQKTQMDARLEQAAQADYEDEVARAREFFAGDNNDNQNRRQFEAAANRE